MVEPLFLLLRGLGHGPAIHLVLDGTFENLDLLHPKIQSLFASLQSGTALGNETFPRFTWEHYQLVWSKAKEKTPSCRHYSLHFGRYMAVCQDNNLTNLHTQLGDIPLMSGYSPARWQTGVNVMLPKKAGDFMATNMHTILLYDAEFNGLWKWLG